MKRHIVYAVTGGSGAPIAVRMLELMLRDKELSVSMIMSDHAVEVFAVESGIKLGKSTAEIRAGLQKHFKTGKNFELIDSHNMAAKISSGSQLNQGMIIAPCSMSTLGAIANGITMNLIHRAASVMLKEKRPLILVPRESPLSPIHLKNMLELSRIGAHIVPPTTAFYHHPKTVRDMVDFVCMKVLDLAGVRHSLDTRWKGCED